tara:strand:+ start:73 stop:405 length:333 start_codon:yes stop_codon:yes gene_type:complete
MLLRYKDIKCDNPKCDVYIKCDFDKYIDHLNKHCPKCGDNLLTQKDYDSCKKVMDFQEKIDEFFYPLRWINPFFYFDKYFGENLDDAINVNIHYGKNKERAKVPKANPKK